MNAMQCSAGQTDRQTDRHYFIWSLIQYIVSRPRDKGGGGRGWGWSSRPLDKVRGVVSKNVFRPFGPQFDLKMGVWAVPRAPPLDPPLQCSVGPPLRSQYCGRSCKMSRSGALRFCKISKYNLNSSQIKSYWKTQIDSKTISLFQALR